MICLPCREQNHNGCPTYMITNGVGHVEKTWCDCAHQAEGVNRELARMEARNGTEVEAEATEES